jgi:eukaryotic-like serine/threonine-protein kinase
MTGEQWSSVRRLLDEALDNPQDRPALLAKLRDSDPEMCEELERLLGDIEDEEDSDGERELAQALRGQTIGPYTIVREIGRGGSGTVVLAAREEAGVRVEVALKFLRGDFLGDARRPAIQRELRALARLDHPHIVRLLNWGTVPGGLLYLAIEYVDGQTITQYCAEKRLGLADRLALFQQVCEAVEHAHKNLVVHRDLKPANIFVKHDGTVKLLDFGIAKLLSADDTLTVTAAPHLTPAYASPEQVRGDAIATATDVYSLGAVLYELLTGALPYRLSTRSFEETSRAVLDQEPQRPNLAPDPANIVLKALRKEPEARYASVDQMSSDIRRYLEGRPVLASAGSRVYVLRRFVGRNRAVVALASLAICALIAGAALTAWKWRAAEQNLRIAELRYGALRGFAHSILTTLNQPSSPSQTEAARLIANVTVDYLDQLGRERVADDQLQMDIAAAYGTLGDAEGDAFNPNRGNSAVALEDYGKAHLILLAQWRAHPDAAHGVALLWNFSHVGNLIADARQAAEFLADGMPIASELVAKYPGDFDVFNPCAILFESRGKRLWRSGDLAAAIESFRQARDLARNALGQRSADPKSLQTAAAENGLLCRLHTLTGDFSSAVSEGLESKRLGEQLLAVKRTPKTRRDTAVNSLFLCVTRREMGDLSGASACMLQTFEQLTGIAAEDPANAGAQWDLAAAYAETGEIFAARRMPSEALSSFREALRLSQQQSAKDPLNHNGYRVYGTNLIRVGGILANSRADVAESEALFDQAIAVCSRAQAVAPSDAYAAASLAKAYRGKAEVASRRQDTIEAIRALQQAVNLWCDVRKRCPLDIDLRAGAEEAEQALAQLNR